MKKVFTKIKKFSFLKEKKTDGEFNLVLRVFFSEMEDLFFDLDIFNYQERVEEQGEGSIARYLRRKIRLEPVGPQKQEMSISFNENVFSDVFVRILLDENGEVIRVLEFYEDTAKFLQMVQELSEKGEQKC